MRVSSSRFDFVQTSFLLMLPPVFWAGNAIVGRLVVGVIPPLAFNFGRWAIAFLILLPFCYRELKDISFCWRSFLRFFVLGFLGIASYNALQYMALVSSSPINVTLVASSIPVFMLLVGRFVYGVHFRLVALMGVLLSVLGVLVVISRGDLFALLALELVVGDLLMLVAALSWTFYSWMLARPDPQLSMVEKIRSHWVAFLAIQIGFGAISSFIFAVIDWWLSLDAWTYKLEWGPTLIAALVYVAIFPGIVAFRAWGLAVQRVGPSFAGVVVNLTPLLAALFSAVFLNEKPELYHGLAFLLIVIGIAVFQRAR